MSETITPLRRSLSVVLLVLFGLAPSAEAQTAPSAPATQGAAAPVTEPDATKAIGLLRAELIDAFNKGDLDRLLSHLDPDCVVTWQNAEVCRGPEAVRAYYNKMMTGPDRRVEKVAADPVVDDRHVYGDWAVSWGNMRDHFTLTDGSDLRFDSRFTATIVRRGEVWKVASFHASLNAFDNSILRMVGRKALTWGAVIAGALGLALGLIVGRIFAGRRRGELEATGAT
jgi:uncharacterized protein (TIGR02246 family)